MNKIILYTILEASARPDFSLNGGMAPLYSLPTEDAPAQTRQGCRMPDGRVLVPITIADESEEEERLAKLLLPRHPGSAVMKVPAPTYGAACLDYYADHVYHQLLEDGQIQRPLALATLNSGGIMNVHTQGGCEVYDLDCQDGEAGDLFEFPLTVKPLLEQFFDSEGIPPYVRFLDPDERRAFLTLTDEHGQVLDSIPATWSVLNGNVHLEVAALGPHRYESLGALFCSAVHITENPPDVPTNVQAPGTTHELPTPIRMDAFISDPGFNFLVIDLDTLGIDATEHPSDVPRA